MDTYVTGSTIRLLREAKGLTQAELAGKLAVSAKTISKWETAKGLPDISLLEPLAAALGVSVLELMQGEPVVNRNRAANLLRSKLSRLPHLWECAPRHRSGGGQLLRHHSAPIGHRRRRPCRRTPPTDRGAGRG